MLLYMYSVRDAVTEVYSSPFYTHNDQAAVRLFETSVNDPSTTICAHPEDYALFKLGVFDDGAGSVTPLVQPLRVINALELVQPKAGIVSADIAKLSNDVSSLRNAVSSAMLAMSRPAPVAPSVPNPSRWWHFWRS